MALLSFLSGKTVVVTGGAGFIGSHLSEKLLELGAKVFAVDNLLSGHRENIAHLEKNPQFTFIQADVTTPPESYLPKGTTFDLFFHFASLASPPKYQAHPVETYLANSLGTHLLLQFIHQQAPQARFVFASTSEIYGTPLEHPQSEKYWGNVNPNGIRSCYDESKRLGETICGVHHRDLGVDVRIVRIFNTYGPRIDLEDGRIIPGFIAAILSGQPLTIFGDGTQTRSFCYVDDLVEGILRLASIENGQGKTVNLGNPEEHTVQEVAQIIQEVAGDQKEIQYQPLPQDDPTRRKPDITFAKELLDWTPQVDFQTGLTKTLTYFRSTQAV